MIIFTRYPEPGKTKTRLIPALGAEGAANFQRQMTEDTVSLVRELLNSSGISFEVRFSGGSLQLMQSWLGYDLVYQEQGDGNLGDRMSRSFSHSFASGVQRVLIIGTDCPDLNVQILNTAFDKLYSYDLVLGPAEDGGYYLIGLRQPVPELFTTIDWGTSKVLQQTVNIAQKLNLSPSYLPVLRDIDRPEDLAPVPI